MSRWDCNRNFSQQNYGSNKNMTGSMLGDLSRSIFVAPPKQVQRNNQLNQPHNQIYNPNSVMSRACSRIRLNIEDIACQRHQNKKMLYS